MKMDFAGIESSVYIGVMFSNFPGVTKVGFSQKLDVNFL